MTLLEREKIFSLCFYSVKKLLKKSLFFNLFVKFLLAKNLIP